MCFERLVKQTAADLASDQCFSVGLTIHSNSTSPDTTPVLYSCILHIILCNHICIITIVSKVCRVGVLMNTMTLGMVKLGINAVGINVTSIGTWGTLPLT